jgi:hypothetical protein
VVRIASSPAVCITAFIEAPDRARALVIFGVLLIITGLVQ